MTNKIKTIAPVFIGTILEWYDFSIFVFLTPILSEIFFKSSSHILSSMMAYAVFAIGFIVRPLGAVFFGQMADNCGRKKSMMLSMLVITISTACIGILPTYEQIGIIAPIMIVILRLIQGFCIGGESSGSALYILEMYPNKNRGVLSSFMWSSVGLGMLLGSLVTTLMFYLFSENQLYNGFWRLPLIFSLLACVIGLYFRQKVPETYLYQHQKNSNEKNKTYFHHIIKENKKTIFSIVLLYALSSIITYVLFIFMPVYINQYTAIGLKTSSLITTAALSCVTLLVPLSGHVSDKIGRKLCLYIGSIGFIILSIPLYLYISEEKTIFSFMISYLVFVILAILYQGALTASVQESTSTKVRFTVTSVGYNISYGFFGGTAPLVVSWMSKISNIAIIPGIYLTIFAFLSFLAVYKMKETYKIQLE